MITGLSLTCLAPDRQPAAGTTIPCGKNGECLGLRAFVNIMRPIGPALAAQLLNPPTGCRLQKSWGGHHENEVERYRICVRRLAVVGAESDARASLGSRRHRCLRDPAGWRDRTGRPGGRTGRQCLRHDLRLQLGRRRYRPRATLRIRPGRTPHPAEERRQLDAASARRRLPPDHPRAAGHRLRRRPGAQGRPAHRRLVRLHDGDHARPAAPASMQ